MGKYPFYCFVMHYFVYILVSNHIEEEGKAGCFAIIVLQMYCYCNCSVALPHGTVGWSAVCDCGFFLIILTYFSKLVSKEKRTNPGGLRWGARVGQPWGFNI